MPFYDYECADCGPFTAMRPIAAFAEPAPCPDCGSAAPRLMAAPLLGGAAAPAPASAAPARAHAGGCGCCAPRRKRLTAEAV